MFKLVQINGVSFNSDSDKHYFIDSESGLGNPPVRLINYDVPGENFGIFVSAFYGKRQFTLSGWVVGDSMSDFVQRRDTLYKALDITNGEQPVVFTLANDRIVQINAVCKQLDLSQQAGDIVAAQFQAQFEGSFPFLLTPTVNQYSIALPLGGGGTVPAPTMPMALGGNLGGNITVVNNGNAPYWPTARIYGPVTNPVITNQTLGLALQLTITLSASEYLDIDFKRKSIFDNFGTNQYSTKSGDWFYLSPGSSIIAFSASSYSASSLCNIFAQDSYLGI